MELFVPELFAERPELRDGRERSSPPICCATSQGAEATAGTRVVVEDSQGRSRSIGAEKYQETQNTHTQKKLRYPQQQKETL